jgi:predicted GNAT superfamily acetyltransferase
MTRGMSDGLTIRDFQTVEEYHDCVALQEETWGSGFSEGVSPAIQKVAQILGGVASGAYDAEGRLIGFVFGMTGLRDGEVVHWSDMLAVRDGTRDGGLGRRLKAYQREKMLRLGVETMFWTFDPLQSRNAHLNITKLGAVVREYVPDMYGDTDSPLHRGIGTDRFVALWLMRSERVVARLGEDPHAPFGGAIGVGAARALRGAVPALEAADSPAGEAGVHPHPGEPDLQLMEDAVSVAIPSDVVSLMADDGGLAVAWRGATRTALAHYMARGYEVREFDRGPRVSRYVLVRGP